MNIQYETLVFERDFEASPARLFQAYADPRQREKWCTPSPETVMSIDDSEVRTGGRETARCGKDGNLTWTMKVVYHRVVENCQITFTEELWNEGQILTVALITFEFEERGANSTRLTLTDQITSFVGEDGIDGHRDGYTKALVNLAASLVPA